MRVCMLSTGFPRFQGDLFGTFVWELARALSLQGVQVEVVAPHERGLPVREVVEGVQVRRFRYFAPSIWQKVAYGGGIPSNLRTSWMARLQVPFFLLGFCWKALGAMRRCQLVHCHWTASGLVALVAGRLWRRPLVLSVRGSDVHLLGEGLMARLSRRVWRGMDAVLAVSEDIAAKLSEQGVEGVQVVYNGVDGRFHPRDRGEMRRRLGLEEERFVALFVGLIVPVKGVDVLLEAVRRIGDTRLLCVLVGDGLLKETMEEQVAAAGLQHLFLFAGRRSSEEVPLWMAAADCLVLPSRSEGRPNVVLEAQASGLPVLATRVGGTPELVRDGETGLLVESEDAEGLARCLEALMADPDLCQRLGQTGSQSIAEQGLTWEASARRVLAIYREILEA